jgi:hypothetical protein
MIYKMFHTKKAVSLSFNTIIIAIISLVVLIVIIAIFREQIGDIAQRFTVIREKETDKSIIESAFGCSEGSFTCIDNVIHECKNSEWSRIQDCSNKKCKDGSCV